MAGSSTSELRSAYVAEVTAGTIPATPGFTTLHRPAAMMAKPTIIEGRSLIAKGARHGQGYSGIDVTGSLESPLIYGVYDDFLATLLQGAWSSDVLKDGKAETTVAVENTIPAGTGGTATMMRYRGVEATSGSLSLKARSAASLSLQLVGRGSDDATTTAITGATYTDPTEADPLSSGEDVGTIVFDGYTLDCMEALEIAFAFEKRDLQPKISSNDLCGITRGDFLPTLSANMYIESNFLAIYNASRARHTGFEITIPLGAVTGEKYTLVFPKCFFGETELDWSGASAMQKVQILPQYDTSSGATMTATRAIA
jgi:hypothetical protein